MYIKKFVYIVTGMDCLEWEKVYTMGVFTSKIKAEMAVTQFTLEDESQERDRFYSIEKMEVNKVSLS